MSWILRWIQWIRFVRQHGREVMDSMGNVTLGVGGSNYDILEMSAKKRKEAHLFHEDPLDPSNPNNVLGSFTLDVGTPADGK